MLVPVRYPLPTECTFTYAHVGRGGGGTGNCKGFGNKMIDSVGSVGLMLGSLRGPATSFPHFQANPDPLASARGLERDDPEGDACSAWPRR